MLYIEPHSRIFGRFWQRAFLALALIFFSFQVVAGEREDFRAAPESATGLQHPAVATGTEFMAVTSHLEATKAGYDILSRGGTAADAAVAVQLVLGLVEPQSSGIGGGGFVLYYDAQKRTVMTLDGRETAPALAGKHLFRGADGKPMEFYDAALGGRAVGVPGTLRLLEKLHKKHGKMPWRDLFSPAVALAETGFEVTPRLSKMVHQDYRRLGRFTDTRLYFFPDGVTPVRPGYFLRNPKYAAVLRKVALEGADAFYSGEIAQDIVKAVREVPENPGLLSMEDLEKYRVRSRSPVCGVYRGYKICSVAEPSSGGLTLLSALGMLEHFNLGELGPDNPKSWHLIAEASRLAFADRNYYMADPDFVETPGKALLDPDYLEKRARMISLEGALQNAQPGTPPGWDAAPQQPDMAPKPPGTTHMCLIDRYGNIVSMTGSIENAFGSRVMTEGFLLNNQLTDFSFEPERDGQPVANRVEGGKRPRSSMAPVIIFDPLGRPFLVIGSAGGSAIIGYVLERIVALIDWDMDVQEALEAPNIIHLGTKIEMEPAAEPLSAGLKQRGHPVEIKELNSGLTAIHIKNGLYTGAADPRREGGGMGR
ncbi:MAG: gamma-glutamyltransferase [Rhodospirillales bacterium]|nr:gamma-glutamyltransferase [Alphaproteobacteria bacterium]USO02910.1 MAG: gamma-glutamyltransferase [Rhodospirillales bacterium]